MSLSTNTSFLPTFAVVVVHSKFVSVAVERVQSLIYCKDFMILKREESL